ncbi:tryptophan--tRNA ligase [Candidatus Pelagibacter communis]|uniref:tryptophan--tRNA ligase n=1 Tax=Pelagibacter ubique TaxID=198252 RepID=UPI00094CE593|nr:tryptophan--tRNA ligase [Candidatus Pelagibacter ubique]|tara:strand:- start:573 stop:1574 length:1002 start_codon:yes stop_codon:yes gene_type:complete
MSKKIFSGVQPTGNLHLGNYLGAIKNFVELNNDLENDCIFCVVDLHAITVKQDPKELKNNIRETVATFVACGINPKKSIIFSQSSVPAHSEGAWLLSCVARMGWLNRMTQFKEKAGKDKEKASIGLFSYPVLMAADILLYDSTHVPVGEDQKQHLELCRDIAQRFNNEYKVDNFFKTPEPLIQKEFSRIMSLKDGTKKMSKSELSDLSRINLTDDKDLIVNKIKKAKTDPLPLPSSLDELRERPEAKNLLGIYSSLLNSTMSKSISEFEGKNFSEFKEKLSEVLAEKMDPISKEIKKLMNEKRFLDEILLDGYKKAYEISFLKIKKMHEIIGF